MTRVAILAPVFLAMSVSAVPQYNVRSPAGVCPTDYTGTPFNVGDTFDCTLYYTCANGVFGVAQSCPFPKCFDSESSQCQDCTGVSGCENQYPPLPGWASPPSIGWTTPPLVGWEPPPSTGWTTSPPAGWSPPSGWTSSNEGECPVGTVENPVGSCPETDSETSTYLYDSADCNIFYQCSDGDTVCFLCPSTLCFNSAINVCDYCSNINVQLCGGDGYRSFPANLTALA